METAFQTHMIVITSSGWYFTFNRTPHYLDDDVTQYMQQTRLLNNHLYFIRFTFQKNHAVKMNKWTRELLTHFFISFSLPSSPSGLQMCRVCSMATSRCLLHPYHWLHNEALTVTLHGHWNGFDKTDSYQTGDPGIPPPFSASSLSASSSCLLSVDWEDARGRMLERGGMPGYLSDSYTVCQYRSNAMQMLPQCSL